MICPLFANTIGEIIVRTLAVIGGAAIGAVAAGACLGWVERKFFTDQALPRYGYYTVQGVAGILCGLLTFYLVFGTGGYGVGGPGGLGLGGGSGDGTKNGKKEPSSKNGKTGKDDKTKPGSGGGRTILRVEILGNEPLRKILKTFDPDRRYRVEGERDPMSLADVQQHVRRLISDNTGLETVEIVLYRDTPVAQQPPVTMLRNWVASLDPPIKVVMLEKLDEPAPVD